MKNSLNIIVVLAALFTSYMLGMNIGFDKGFDQGTKTKSVEIKLTSINVSFGEKQIEEVLCGDKNEY